MKIDTAIRIYRNDTSVRVGTQQFNEAIDYVDADFFDVFDLPFVSGDRATALSNGNNIVISEAIAIKYFGTENPIGKIFDINQFTKQSKN